MSNILATRSAQSAASRERALAWQLRDVLGVDPFHDLRGGIGFDYDVRRTENGYEIEMPVPGFSSSQLDVSVKDETLTVAGKTDRRSFSRSFTIPEDVDVSTIGATARDGMLLLTLTRLPEKQPVKITVS